MAKKKKPIRYLFAYPDPKTNPGKLARLEALADVYLPYVQECIDAMVAKRTCLIAMREFRATFPESKLLSKLQCSARIQAVKTMKSWSISEYDLRVRETIHKLDTPANDRAAFYTIGTHCIVKPQMFGKHEITQDHVDRYWAMFWGGMTTTPSIGDTGQIMFYANAFSIKPIKKAKSFALWIKLQSLEINERISIPLRVPPAMLTAANLAKTVGARRNKIGRWEFTFFDKSTQKILDGSAGTVAVDVGLNVLAATSDGRLLGGNVKYRFDRIYKATRETRRNRMRQGFKEDSKRQTRREMKLTAMVKTETGTAANRLVKAYPNHTFVIEDLDFSGRKGNRRFAYRALQKNLATKAVVLLTNPAYTSQECPSCHYTSPGNRRGTKFRCLSCGRISHADVIGGINLLGRSKDKQIGPKADAPDVRTILRTRYWNDRNSAAGRSTRPRRRPGCLLRSRATRAHSVKLCHSQK